MGNACQSDANKAEVNTEVSNVMGSPMPGMAGSAPITDPAALPGFEQQPLSRPADHSHAIAPPCAAPCEPCGASPAFPVAMPFDSSPAFGGMEVHEEYGMGHVQPAEFFQERVCEGPNCPKPTHEEIAPGQYRDLATGEIIYAENYVAPQSGEDAIVRKSNGETVRLSVNGSQHRMSAGSRMPNRMSAGSRRPVSYNGSVQQGSNNLIVAAAMEVEEPKEAETEEPAQPKEEAPKKKKRRGLFRRRKNRGGDDY